MSVIWKWPWKNDVLISHSKIENEIKKKDNKYLYFLKLMDEKDLWIGFIDFLSQFPLFWFFPFHVIYSINEIMLRKEEKIKTVDILEQTQDAIDNFSIKIFTKNF